MECSRQQPKVKMLLLSHCALCMFHMIDGQNMGDQIMSDRAYKRGRSDCVLAFHSFLVEVQTKLATYVLRMRNNLEKDRG